MYRTALGRETNMLIKKIGIGLCFGLSISLAAPHSVQAYAVSDPAQLAQVVANVMQMTAQVQQLMEMVKKGQQMLASIGDLQKMATEAIDSVKGAVDTVSGAVDSVQGAVDSVKDTVGSVQDSVKDTVDSAKGAASDALDSILSGKGSTSGVVSSTSTTTEGMQKAGLTEQSFESAAQTQMVIQDKLLPPSGDAAKQQTNTEIEERKQLQKEVAQSALTDAYANALAYLSETSKKEVTAPSGEDTLIGKANDTVLVIMSAEEEYRRGNQLLAEQLKVMSSQGITQATPYVD